MNDSFKKVSAFAMAGAFAAALSMAAAPGAIAADMEECYGIAKATENDCAAEGNNSCAGTSKVDYDGKAWKLVEKGTCENIDTPFGKGSLTALDNRPPQG